LKPLSSKEGTMGWRAKSENGRAGGREAIENVLGQSLVIHGELVADGAFRIDGTIEGSVASKAGIVIGESGIVRGDVRGVDIVVAGQINGNVVCSGHLEILAKGRIEGNIDAQSVRIETGGVFRGTSRMGAESAAVEKTGDDAAGDAAGSGRHAAMDASSKSGASHGHLSPVA
jgi:cytoskeletal protein CcmA (bactofilin family)